MMPWSKCLLAGLMAASTALADDGGSGAFGDGTGGVTTWADQAPKGDSLQLTLTNASGQPNPIQYNVVPIISNKAFDGTDENNKTGVVIDGIMVVAGPSNYQRLTDSNTVAYLSCDHGAGPGDTFITANTMLDALISSSIKAVVLYSLVANGCLLGNVGSLHFDILSMIDAGDAQQVLSYLNATGNGGMERVSITGNASTPDPGGPLGSPGSSSNSAVAMSILYSITGLIALLFVIIIGTGAWRAHRYPERYGPRGAVAGRPRQSRAKGLARAVLETIPIVKFSNQQPAKPDPELELETATMDDAEVAAAAQRAGVPEARRDGRLEASPAILSGEHNVDEAEPPREPSAPAETAAESATAADEASTSAGGNLGCSICTEDFKVGEDMRVLPCNHQFHPNCIDPWLINVSGTCPLCRLDLRPEAGRSSGDSPSGSPALPPPLALEGGDEVGGPAAQRNRVSRIFDINRLRQASAEEQMAALRQMRRRSEADATTATATTNVRGVLADAPTTTTAADARGATADGEERGQRARLAAKLKEKFRIRTRARSPGP